MADSLVGGAFDILIKIGFLNLIVPFVLFYSIVFGMLEKTQLFAADKAKAKDESRNLHSLIAFALGITATAASYAVGITQNFLPVLGIASVVLLGLMMVLGMAFGPEFDANISKSKPYKVIIGITAIVLMLAAVLIIAYNGLIVGTPCNDNSLTPVNSLNPGAGECTKFMDITATDFYVMGFNVKTLIGSLFTSDVIGILIVLGVIGFTIYFVTAKK
ncbi:MAG: hypothetical protein WC393_05645 [Candidatus Nanoarchaeia archaeon]|jgi:hypothetical protein